MKITYELDLNTFEAWSGGENTLDRIIENGLVNQFEMLLEDCYPDGMSETQLNDILRFDSDWVYETLGLETESSLREKIEEIECQIEDLKDDFEDDILNAEIEDDEEKREYWCKYYEDDYNDLIEQLEELKEELESL